MVVRLLLKQIFFYLNIWVSLIDFKSSPAEQHLHSLISLTCSIWANTFFKHILEKKKKKNLEKSITSGFKVTKKSNLWMVTEIFFFLKKEIPTSGCGKNAYFIPVTQKSQSMYKELGSFRVKS